MSLPRTRSRKTSESERGDKTDSDKKKLGSGGHAAAIKNGKTGSPAQSKTRRRSSVTEHTKPSNKLEMKKRTVSDAHTKPIHAAGSTHTNETTKSPGKTTAQSRSVTHGKSPKKSEVHKPQTNKKPEQDKNDPGKDDPTETNEAVTTAVSQDVENVPDEKPDDNHDQS